MSRDYLYTVSTMFDKLWAWLMGVITYLASLFGLNRATAVAVTEQREEKEEKEVEAAPEPENQ